jgi:hypothetical protein
MGEMNLRYISDVVLSGFMLFLPVNRQNKKKAIISLLIT